MASIMNVYEELAHSLGLTEEDMVQMAIVASEGDAKRAFESMDLGLGMHKLLIVCTTL